MNGIVDLDGALLPPVEGSEGLKQLVHEYFFGKGTDWADLEPYFRRMLGNLPGQLYAIPYTDDRRGHVFHLCDVHFLEAWLRHPNFRMVK